MRAFLVVLMVPLFSSCDGAREDALLEAQFDRRLAELMELKVAEDSAEKFVAVTRVTPEELAALGTGVTVSRAAVKEQFIDLRFHGEGSREDAVQFIRAIRVASRAVLVTAFEVRDGSWDVNAALAAGPKPVPRAPLAPLVEPSWCFDDCRTRQQRIEATRKAVTETEVRFAPVLQRAQQRRELAQLTDVAARFPVVSDDVLTALEKAEWVPRESQILFLRDEVVIAAPKTSELDCQRSFEALGTCRFDELNGKLQLTLR